MHQSYASSDLGKVPCCNGDQLDTGVELIAMESIVAEPARAHAHERGEAAHELVGDRQQGPHTADCERVGERDRDPSR
jgi:hypothetical protein